MAALSHAVWLCCLGNLGSPHQRVQFLLLTGPRTRSHHGHRIPPARCTQPPLSEMASCVLGLRPPWEQSVFPGQGQAQTP